MQTQREYGSMTRRRFMEMAGGAAAGVAALASTGFGAGWAANTPRVDADRLAYREDETDVLIIGGGMAGVFAAVKAHDAGARTMLVSKGRLGASGQTPFAKGIFAFDPATSDMSLDEFVEAVSRSALGTNHPVYTRQMAEHSLARVAELREWGFFESALYNNAFRRPIDQREIPVWERITVTHLLKQDGRIAGAAGFSLDDDSVHFFKAKSVVLCTGAGGFKPNGFPICDLTHDGTVMAYNIGAKVTGKEWNDGHPGQATNAAACFDAWHGMFERTPSVVGVGIRHDLGVDLNYRAYVAGNPVQMETHGGVGTGRELEGGPYTPAEFARGEASGGSQRRREGRGPRRPPGPAGESGPGDGDAPPGMGGSLVGGSSAGMAIHKSEGLLPINEKCESSVSGLYAAGDALGSYMAGAIYTQVGSSLAGSAVQGAVAGEAAADYSDGLDLPGISTRRADEVREEILAPLKRESGYGPAWVTQVLQGIMIPNFVTYIKKEKILKAALAYVEELRDHHLPMLRAADMHELRLAHETGNMVVSAEMKLRASIMRTESRCSHYRLDYPDVDDRNWRAWINLFKGDDGTMQLEKQAFGSWPS